MKILLDNCVHKAVAQFFPGHVVKTTAKMGWANLGNGALPAAAAAQFDLFVTTDKNVRHQQNLATLPLPVVELNALDTRIGSLRKLEPYMPAALAAVANARFVAVHEDGTIETV